MSKILDIDPFDPRVVAAAEDKQYEDAKEMDAEVLAYIRRRNQAYKSVFNRDNEDVRIVLEDLAVFARAYQSRYNASQKLQDMAEGRAEVFYRIMDYTRLTHDELYAKLTAARARQGL